MTEIAIYLRTATDTADNAAERAQLAACVDHAVQQGWTVVATYSDPRASGTAVRPGLAQMLADAAAGRFSTVLASDINRYSRSLEQLDAVRRHLRRANVSMFSVSDGDLAVVPVSDGRKARRLSSAGSRRPS